MNHSRQPSGKTTVDWGDLQRARHGRPLEWLAERFIFAVALSTLLVIFLIFIFVGREALPIFRGQMNSAAVQPVLPPEELDRLSSEELGRYLGLTSGQVATMDRETLRALMEVRVEAQNEVPEATRADQDARVNTTAWRYLLLPHQWTDYSRPEYVWQPVGGIKKYNLIPLVVGSLKVTLVGLLFAVPLAVAAAIYVSQLASPYWKEWIKPGIELLSAIPSVVMGAFGLLVLAPLLKRVLGYEMPLNAFVAGIALGLTAIPMVFSIAEDALTSVPRSYVQAALALGASRWQTAWQIVLPAAIPGVFAAVVLGFGRTIGETMVVLIASGNASLISWSLFDSARSMTATIAAEMAETVVGSPHYRILFLLGVVLFSVTFVSNLIGDVVIHRLKHRLEGNA